MRVCEKMVIYLGIKTPQSKKERKYTWQKKARISCSWNDCKYTWEKTTRISCHNFETNGRPNSSNFRCRFLEHFFLALSCFGSGGGGVGFHWEISIGIGAWTIFVKTCCLAKFRGFSLFWWLTLCANGHNIVDQQLPTLLDVTCCVRLHTQQCWIRLHSSCNIVGAAHANYAWFTKTYGWYPSHDGLQVPTLLGVVASVCTPLPTRSQQLPTLFRRNIVGSCCIRLHTTANTHATTPNII